MCTVTIIPKGNNDFVLTSNRDEAPNRVSLVPDFYNVKGVKVLFPKDELSDGTWIGVSEKNRLVCVLNGGFEKHEKQAQYRKSRGVVAKDFIIADDIVNFIETYSLINIEPFTTVIVDWNKRLKFYELVWDGKDRYIRELALEPKIWSSSTLYNKSMRNERKKWFENFASKKELNASTMSEFHKTAGNNNKDYGVIMDRGFVKTTSITQVEKSGNTLHMAYENLQEDIVANQMFSLNN